MTQASAGGHCAPLLGSRPNTLTALERDDREPTLEVLSRLAAALGGELSVRFHPGTGPSIRDHLQAAMTECLVQSVHERWRVELEVSVFAPTRGVIDVVLRDGAGTVIACEAQSEVRRLEQVIRWARIKSEALGPSGPASRRRGCCSCEHHRRHDPWLPGMRRS